MDRDAVLWLAEHRTGPFDAVCVALGFAGFAGLAWIAIAPLVARRARVSVLPVLAATAACVWTADLVTLAIKVLVQRPRPFEAVPGVDALMGATVGASFPSGHAATSAAGAILLALILPRAALALALLALAIGFSRVYGGVHYPTDVLAGAGIGAAVAAATAVLRARRWPSAGPRRRRAGPRAG
ncbi:MAG: phosphatase PAP2 family protein [Thermoleophilia bacterium]|nr:phosphatase PAP2 family protein [Thermoleophilia bacterium]